jgi:hypothetical protein
MKKVSSFFFALIIAATLAGCATANNQGERTPEMHPGHVGHEVHY